jgi:hopene-associated glycosyltransferase HpnB
MSLALTIIGSLALVAWLYVFCLRGWFWIFPYLPLTKTASFVMRVVGVIPARNEAEHIGEAVSSVLTQEGVELTQLIVVDDGSTDDTAAQARRAAAACGKADCLNVIAGAPLPPGWSGKVWAMQQGVEAAKRLRPDLLWFTDADIAHGKAVAATLADIAESGYEMVSAMVELRCVTPAEKLLVPAFVYFFFQLYPPQWIAAPQRATAGAAGGCILVRPEALANAGGLAAIKGAIIDDCALAAAVKRAGGRLRLGATRDSRSLRGYSTFAGVLSMVSRNAFNQLRHSSILLAGTVLNMLLMYVAPVALLFCRKPLPFALGAASLLLMFASYIPTVRAYHRNRIWALTLPLAACFYVGATIHSALRYWSGRGGEWKGRHQDIATGS